MARRTKAEIDRIKRWIYQLCNDLYSMNVESRVAAN